MTRKLFEKLLIALVSICFFSISVGAAGLKANLPADMFNKAESVVSRKIEGDVEFGSPVRYFDHVPCDTLTISILDSLHIINDTGRAKWYIPVYKDMVLVGEVFVCRFPNKPNISAVYNPYGISTVSISEISKTWPASSGYHPCIIDCMSHIMYYIPELSEPNLTMITKGYNYFDTTSIFRKNKLQKQLAAANAKTDKEVKAVAELYLEQEKLSSNEEESEFKDIVPAQQTIEWLQNNN